MYGKSNSSVDTTAAGAMGSLGATPHRQSTPRPPACTQAPQRRPMHSAPLPARGSYLAKEHVYYCCKWRTPPLLAPLGLLGVW